MQQLQRSPEDLLAEITRLRSRLAEASETLDAIRHGAVDAIVVGVGGSERVYTLRGADEPYRIIVEQMKEGALNVTTDGTILYANAQLEKLLGVPNAHVVGANFPSFCPAEQVFEVQALLAVERGETRRIDTALLNSKGSTPVSITATPIEFEGTRSISLVVVDQTERKRNEEILAAEKLARAILDRVGEAVVVLDPADRIIRANDAAHALAGRNVLLARFDEVFPFTPGDSGNRLADRADGHFDLALHHEDVVRGMEVNLRRADGAVATVLMSAGPLLSENREVMGSVITLTDITSRKRMEDALQQSNEELQRFAYAASHDLREPLRTIGAMSELVMRQHKGRLGEETDRMLDHIQTGVGRMSRLISDLLEYARVANEKTVPEVAVDSASLAKVAVANLQQTVAETHAKVTIGDLPAVLGDDQLVQVFQNLIGNALKYRSEKPPEIDVSSRREGGEWIFEIRDNGIGFDMKHAQRVFEIFQRLHARKDYPGTGIGLAICKRIVERHGGRIWAFSQPGQGSTFYFTLPALKTPDQNFASR
jgi:PAS domain S-box-containing protein